MTSSTFTRLASIILLLAGFLVYLQGTGGSLIYDDIPNIADNDLLHIDGQTADEWRTASLSSDSGPLRRPVAMFSFALNHALAGGVSASAMKAVNIAIHFLIGGLIYLFGKEVLGIAFHRRKSELAREIHYAAALAATET